MDRFKAQTNYIFLDRLPTYWQLARFHRPIGFYLVLWPTLWALWFAAEGIPAWDILVIFVLGTALMRAAGCVINDFADRRVDGQVKRTRERPLVSGQASPNEAIGLFVVLCLIAFTLVLLTNTLTIQMSLIGVLLAFCYPFAKRYTHLPQVVLGAAFSWGIVMAYTAQKNQLDEAIWLIFTTNLLWTVAYDTFYAMVDRDDDLKIGVKSTAILFGDNDRLITGLLQIIVLIGLMMIGNRLQMGLYYYLSICVVAGLFGYQQWLVRRRERDACFKAFLNNNWVGLVIFFGIVLDFALMTP